MASVTKTTTNRGEPRYRVRYRDPARRPREKWFDRKIDADRFAREVEVAKDRGAYVDPNAGRITVSDWIQQHEATKLHRRPSTVARDTSLLNNHVLPRFGNRPIGTLQPTEIRAWVAELSSSGLSADTTRKAYRLLASGLEAAVDDGLIARNPARRVDLPPVRRREMRFLNHSEVDHLAAAIDPRYQALVITAAYTGMRFGELAALRLEHLSMLPRTIRVEATLTEVDGRLIVGEPKTKASRRTIVLPQAVIDSLARHLSDYPASPDGYVFTSPDGQPLRNANFRHRFWTPAVRASVGGRLRFHDLRHTHAALLIAAGQHPKVIQERLGHSSIRITLDLYGHLMEGLDQAAADALDDAISATSRGADAGLSEYAPITAKGNQAESGA